MSPDSPPTLPDRLVIRGVLRVPRAFHIGRGSASVISDMALRRDADDRPYLPGSSLAGLLRTTAESLAPFAVGLAPCAGRDQPCVTCDLFGWAPSGADRGEGQASRITVEDARPVRAAPQAVEIRDHVGMDRLQGTARAQLQYDREVAPGNMRFAFEIAVEEPTATEITLLLAVLDQWSDPDLGLRLGARTSAGLGSALVERTSLQYYALEFDDDAQLLAFLTAPVDGDQWDPLPAAARVGGEQVRQMAARPAFAVPEMDAPERYLPQRITLDLLLEAVEPLLVVGYTPKLLPENAEVSDAEPVTALFLDEEGEVTDQVFLPGSSLKGVLRTRAEKIIRTLNYHREGSTPDQYGERISACAVTHKIPDAALAGEVEAPEPLRLYGCFSGGRMDSAQGAEEPAIYEASCATCRLFGNTALGGRLLVGDGVLTGEEAARTKLFDHVAIDRFSGGAADARKFDTRPLIPGVRFRVRLELARPEPWMLGLLTLLVKDLGDGDLWVGHATHRGFGRVEARVEQATVYALPGSHLDALAEEKGLERTERGDLYRRYRLDEDAWPPAEDGDASSTAAFLQAAFDDFQSLVQALEQAQLGGVQEERANGT